MPVRMPGRAIARLGLLMALLAAGGLLWTHRSPQGRIAECRGGTTPLEPGTIGGPFALISESGELMHSDEIITEPTFIYFGYTFCPDICPFDVSRNAEAMEMLEGAGHQVSSIFISVDPERDTPKVLADWTSYMHPKMIGLTGDLDQIKEAAKAYKVFFQKQPGDDEYYLVDHSAFTYLEIPGHGVIDFFDRSATAEDIFQRAACYLDSL